MRLQRSELPPLYAITDIPSDGDYASLVAALAAAGLRWIQIRIKGLGDARFLSEVGRAVGSAPGTTILVNDRPDFAVAAGAAGVHLGQFDLPPAAARRVPGPGRFIIGYSTHDPAAALQAAAHEAVDYVALGPIFRSPTKNVREPLGLSAIQALRPGIEKPLVAIGGIDSSNIADVLDVGADSAAVISALHQNGTLQESAEKLMMACEGRRR